MSNRKLVVLYTQDPNNGVGSDREGENLPFVTKGQGETQLKNITYKNYYR